jgi:hypothetical protein
MALHESVNAARGARSTTHDFCLAKNPISITRRQANSRLRLGAIWDQANEVVPILRERAEQGREAISPLSLAPNHGMPTKSSQITIVDKAARLRRDKSILTLSRFSRSSWYFSPSPTTALHNRTFFCLRESHQSQATSVRNWPPLGSSSKTPGEPGAVNLHPPIPERTFRSAARRWSDFSKSRSSTARYIGHLV